MDFSQVQPQTYLNIDLYIKNYLVSTIKICDLNFSKFKSS